ncbi:hypothetical protein GCM10023188_46980 [Pontibacter saemangeumensis]|uniref:Uncharacterized protein n=1 Tax=Pontibacter saemangeumensis TaxID=1084525 RepID=A0ABP8M549_9BACT
MPKLNLTWQETDAQFLEALLLATGGEGGATLPDVLLMADAIDGTVFSLQEVEQALEKLVAINYIHVQKNKLSLAEGFLQAYTPLEGEEEQLLQLLESNELTAEKVEEARSTLKKYKLKNHYQQYMEQYGG